LPKHMPWTSPPKLAAAVCVAFGIVVLVLNLVIALGNMWTEHTPKKCY
jgi:sodium-coupled neutral amino acid transporter 11